MQNEDIIRLLENRNSNEKPGVGFYNMNGGDQSCIEANKAGLEMLAAELLKAAERIKDIENDSVQTLHITLNRDWIHDEIGLDYIKPVTHFELQKREIYTPDWKDSLVKYGCISVLIILAFCTIIGLGTILKWFF